MANAVARTNASNVVSVDLDRLNYDVVKNNFKKLEGKLGGGAIKRQFPGTQITFKKGEYQVGFGKNVQTEDELTLVMNAPHLMLTWCKWEDGEGEGKRFPRYLPPVLPYSDHPAELADRETLGDLDSDEWEVLDGTPQDPWKLTIVVPVRDKDESEVNHFMVSSPSASKALFAFVQNGVVDEMQMKPGKLPVVKFSSEKQKFDKKVADKRGKESTKKVIFDAPKMAVVGWTDVEDCDRINAGVAMGDNGESAELGEVNVKARSGDAKALAAPKKEAVKAKGGKSRKAVDESEL